MKTSSKTTLLSKIGRKEVDDEKVQSTVPVKSPAEGKELVVSHRLSDKRNNDDSRESAEVVHNNLFEKRRNTFFGKNFYILVKHCEKTWHSAAIRVLGGKLNSTFK